MGNTWTIVFAISLFIIITFLYWKITKGYTKKVYGEKLFKNWTSRTFYWQAILLGSGGITVMILLLLKSGNVLPF